MKVVIGGASGLVGSALRQRLADAGHVPISLVRREPAKENEIFWKPQTGKLEADELAGVDAIVHLSGEGIADGRWTSSKKRRIRDSRVDSTRVLADCLARLPEADRPKRWVCASAIGYYGDRGNKALNEFSSPGTSFLSDVCIQWESACQRARDAQVSVANARFGVVLSPKGGALAKMLTPFKMGVGGKVGSGEQYMSWISLPDVVAALQFLVEHPEIEGPVNLTAPNPVTNAEFTEALGEALSRPTVMPMPAFAARLAFGEMADELLLSSAKVIPERLQQEKFQFQHVNLEEALADLLDLPRENSSSTTT